MTSLPTKDKWPRDGDIPAFFCGAGIVIYLIAMLPIYRESPFAYDTFYNFWRGKRVWEEPLSVFEPTYVWRFCPLYYTFLCFALHVFGFNPLFYGLTNEVLHVLNVFFLFKLVRRLGGASSDSTAVLTSLFFLFSSTQWGVLWDIGQMMRLACISLSLFSFLLFVEFLFKKRRIYFVSSLILFVSSFGFCEDFVTLPLLLLAMMFILPPRPLPLIRKLLFTLPFFLASLTYVFISFSFGAPQGVGLSVGPHVPLNLFSLAREFFQFLLIPRPEFVPWTGIPAKILRLLPTLLLVLLVGFALKWKKRVNRFLLFGLAWCGVTALFYIFRPMNGVWQGRYLYLPSMGEALLVGIVLSQVRSSVRYWVLLYLLLMNLSTTVFMVHKARAGVNAASKEELPVAFAIVSGLRDQLGAPPEIPPDTILMVEGLPFSLSRLKELLLTYYTSLPAMILEAREGLPLGPLPREENYRVLYMKWEGQRLTVSPYPRMGS